MREREHIAIEFIFTHDFLLAGVIGKNLKLVAYASRFFEAKLLGKPSDFGFQRLLHIPRSARKQFPHLLDHGAIMFLRDQSLARPFAFLDMIFETDLNFSTLDNLVVQIIIARANGEYIAQGFQQIAEVTGLSIRPIIFRAIANFSCASRTRADKARWLRPHKDTFYHRAG